MVQYFSRPYSLGCEPAGTVAARYPGNLVATSALTSLTTGGQVAAASIGLPAGMLVSNLAVLTGTTAANGPTHFWLALADSSLNVLAVSADQGAAAIPGSTFTKLAMAAAYRVAASGCYYILASASASVTAPTLAGITPAGAVTGLTPVICGTAGTQAAPPAVGAQLNSGTVTFNGSMNFIAWVS